MCRLSIVSKEARAKEVEVIILCELTRFIPLSYLSCNHKVCSNWTGKCVILSDCCFNILSRHHHEASHKNEALSARIAIEIIAKHRNQLYIHMQSLYLSLSIIIMSHESLFHMDLKILSCILSSIFCFQVSELLKYNLSALVRCARGTINIWHWWAIPSTAPNTNQYTTSISIPTYLDIVNQHHRKLQSIPRSYFIEK